MRASVICLLVLAACMSRGREAVPAADALRLSGAWIGLDDAGARWWRLELGAGRAGRGAFESNGAVARYRITDWSSDAAGAVKVAMTRDDETTALDSAPRTISLKGKSDGVWLRLMLGKSEVVLLREDRLIPARNRLKERMAAE
jgi:hypothetical protein